LKEINGSQKINNIDSVNENLRNQNHLKFLNYDKKRHRELIKYSQSLKQQGKSLYQESNDKYLKLLEYSCVLEAQLDWEAHDYYLELLDRVVKEKITISEFLYEFHQTSIVNSEVFNLLETKLVLLSSHEKSLDFSYFISEILDDELLDSLKKFYLKIQKLILDYNLNYFINYGYIY
jgi:hypothetical protein